MGTSISFVGFTVGICLDPFLILPAVIVGLIANKIWLKLATPVLAALLLTVFQSYVVHSSTEILAKAMLARTLGGLLIVYLVAGIAKLARSRWQKDS